MRLPEYKGQTIWATVTAHNMGELPVHDQFDEIRIVVDVDKRTLKETGLEVPCGQKNARICAERWATAGKKVRLFWPQLETFQSRCDLNDVVQRKDFKAPKDYKLIVGGGSKEPPKEPPEEPKPEDPKPEFEGSPAFSDDALALEFAQLHAHDLRYVDEWGYWVRWTGTNWQKDTTLATYDSVRRVCRKAAKTADKDSRPKLIASGKTVASVEKLARCDRRLAATSEQFDANDWLLNTPVEPLI